jgi:DNA-binding transcriptional MerR regulator
METNILDGFVSQQEAASQLQTTPRNLRRWENQPDGLPSVTLGRRKFYSIEDLRNFIEKRKRFPNPREAA